MSSSWRVAGSLDQLLDQLDALAPGRSKASDGSVGDPAHAARDSDHNPRLFGWHSLPLVTARDFTHDPKGGLDCARLAAALCDGRDRRVKYVIWDRRIMSGWDGPAAWTWQPYSGANPHMHHLHLSAVGDARATSRIPWLLPGLACPRPTPVRRTVQLGDRSPEVELVQRWLGVHRPGEQGYGVFDQATDRAVRAYQAMRGIAVDGVVGPITWREMQV